MIECSSSSMCTHGRWFHFLCVHIEKESDVPEGDWWCSKECKLESAKKKRQPSIPVMDDHVFNYTTALTFRGLQDMALRAAVRANDGDDMMALSRMSMPEFYTERHNKYLILGHRLLSGELPINAPLLGICEFNCNASFHGVVSTMTHIAVIF